MRKKETFKFIVILLGFLTASLTAFAEKDPAASEPAPSAQGLVITLDEAIRKALNFNPDLRALRMNVDIARSAITRANTFTNPEASLTFGKGSTVGEGGNRSSITGYDFEVDKQMRLGSWWFNRKAAKAGYEAAKQGLRSAEQALIREVKSTFYSLLSLERNLQLADETVRLNDELAKVARARFERGEVSEVEANIFEVETESSIQERKRLEATSLSEMLRFKNLLGFASEVEVKPQGELFDRELSFNLDELLSFATQNRPDLLAAQNKIKQAKMEATLAKVEALPPVTVGFRRAKEVRGEEFTGIKLGIGVPIFDQNRARIKETDALREQAKAQFEATKLQVLREIRTAYNNLNLLKERIDIYDQKMKPKLEKTLEVYKGAYQNGQAGLFEILINERQYFQAKGNYLNTLNEYDQAAAELERVIGGKLEETLRERRTA